jgi:hypothetical protein
LAENPRVYSDEEFALILRAAAELASQAERPGVSSNGLTLNEMKLAAAQAGLDPALIERATRMLVPRAPASPLERLIGGPLRLEHDVRFQVELDEDAAARLLSALRIRATHFHSSDTGHSSALGMTWQASADGDVLSVSARPDVEGTSVSVVIDRRGTFAVTGIVSALAVILSFIAGIGLHDSLPLIAPSLPVAGIAFVLAVARGFWASSTRKARERIGILMDTVAHTLTRS